MEARAAAGPASRLIVLSGAKGGVGTTTLAVNLAAAMARHGIRTLLVDLDLLRGDVATMCGLEERANLADVLTANKPLDEAVQLGPGGMRVLPGCWAPGEQHLFRQELHDRLVRKLKTYGRMAECVVVDAGNGPTQISRSFWREAHRAVIVTTPDSVALMDAYATIKALIDSRNRPTVQLVVNQAASEVQAMEVHQRLAASCRRFLGLNVEWAGAVPLDGMVANLAVSTRPSVLQSPTLPSSRAMDRLALRLAVAPTKDNDVDAA